MSLVILLCFSTFTCIAYARTRNSLCLTSFDTNRTNFEVCRRSTCLVFLTDELFVKLGPKPHPTPGVPFPCNKRSDLYPGIHGVSFQVQSEISSLNNAYCVYAGGDDCAYNDLHKFLGDAGPGYRFIIFGLLLLTPYRITNSSTPSTPVLSGRMQFLGPKSLPFDIAFGALFKALTVYGWLLVGAAILFWLLARALIVCTLGGGDPINRFPIFWKQFLDGDVVPSVSEEQRSRYKYWLSVWKVSVKGVILLKLIAIEAGFISYLFNADDRKVNLTNALLEKVTVVIDSAEEYFLRRLADPNDNLSGKRLWHTAKDSFEMLQQIRNSKHPSKYGLTYEELIKKALRETGNCNKVRIYATGDITQRYSAVYYYGPGIPGDLRTRINVRIQELVDSRRISEFVGLPDKTDMCGEQPLSVDWTVFVIPLVAIFAVFVIIYCCSFVIEPAAEANDAHG